MRLEGTSKANCHIVVEEGDTCGDVFAFARENDAWFHCGGAAVVNLLFPGQDRPESCAGRMIDDDLFNFRFAQARGRREAEIAKAVM